MAVLFPVDGGERQLIAGTDRRTSKLSIRFGTIACLRPLLNVDYRRLTIENRPPAKPMARCELQLSETTE